jgi:hypothetical protein
MQLHYWNIVKEIELLSNFLPARVRKRRVSGLYVPHSDYFAILVAQYHICPDTVVQSIAHDSAQTEALFNAILSNSRYILSSYVGCKCDMDQCAVQGPTKLA